MHESQQSSGRPFPLSMADEGERVRIVLHRGGKGLDKRLTSLGLNRDSEVRIVHRRGGSLVVGRDDSRFALGAGMAQKIMVVRAL
jgi:ferrous iron transport protein A